MKELYITKLINGIDYYQFSASEQKEITNAILPVVIKNSDDKIVDRAMTYYEARKKIKKRNEALILLGRTPKQYSILGRNKPSELKYLNHSYEITTMGK